MTDGYIQIGVISARDPEGNFLPAVPIYTKRTPEAAQKEEVALHAVAHIFAEKFAQYMQETKRLGVSD